MFAERNRELVSSVLGDLIRAPPDSRRMKAYLVPGAHKQDARVFIHIRAYAWSQGMVFREKRGN